MNDFQYYSPTKFIFGAQAADSVGVTLAQMGFSRPLVVYGQGSVVRSGLLDRVEASLIQAGLEPASLGGIRPNPEVASVREGIAQARTHGADVILAVGGGSVIDAAKAIGFGVPYSGDVWDFFDRKAKPTVCVPIACVLTIPAAGSEASASCVISNDALGMKRGAGSDCFRPVVAFMDPTLTYTLPPYQTAAGLTDMMAHILERYFSGYGEVTVTDNIAIGLMKTLITHGPIALAEPENYQARANIMWTGMLAHNDLAGCGRSVVSGGRPGGWESHALEHELSALNPQITHGAGLAVVMPAWMRYVCHRDPARFARLGQDLFGLEYPTQAQDSGQNPDQALMDAALKAISALQAFFVSLGMPTSLSELGIQEQDIPRLVDGVLASKGDPFGVFMPLTGADAQAIYLSCL